MTYRNTPKIAALKLDDVTHLQKMNEYYINLFCEEYKIEDITKISEIRFKAALNYIFTNYYRLSKYTDKKRTPVIDSVIDYADIGQLNAIGGAYLNICALCDKVPTLTGFSAYTGICENTLHRWESDTGGAGIDSESIPDEVEAMTIYNSIINSDSNSNTPINIYISDSNFLTSISNQDNKSIYNNYLKRFRKSLIDTIKRGKESALSDRLASGGAQAVGIIAILNHQYGWSGNTQNITINAPQTITLADLPKLDTISEDASAGD